MCDYQQCKSRCSRLCGKYMAVEKNTKLTNCGQYGLAGFGPTELFCAGYVSYRSPWQHIIANNQIHGRLQWGFPGVFPDQDYLQIVRDRGHKVYYATVGPVSSNWDRACELFAQIKGGSVDYGKNHSETHRHDQRGNQNFPGFYPEWDGNNKIHLVGHR